MEEEYTTFRWYDYLIFAVTLVVSLGIGIYYACTGGKQRTTQEYLLAGRSMGTFPVALSLYVSGASAILILGSTAELYEHGITLYFSGFGGAIGGLIAAFVTVPQFYGMGFTSAFTFSEYRFNSKFIKLLGAFSFQLSWAVYLGLVLYSPAIALEGVTGIPFIASVLATGAVVVCYSTIGGMKAVIGTDTFQGIVMLAGCLLVLILGTIRNGGIHETWDRNLQKGRLDIDWTPPVPARVDFYGAFFGNIMTTWITFGVTQTTVQRLMSTAGVSYARNVVFWCVPLQLLMYTIVYGCGLVVFAYYDKLGCDPLKTGQIVSANQLLPFYLMDGLKIPAIPGLFTGVLFCAALSTVSSGLNAMAAVTWTDFLEWKFNHWSERKKTTLTKILVLVYGLIGIGFAFAFNYAQGNVLQMSATVFGALDGPIAGAFVLALLFPGVEWKGAVVGIFVSFAISISITIGNSIDFPYLSTLPTNDSLCADLGFNETISRDYKDRSVFPLFMISFTWYSSIAVGITVVTGLFLSYTIFRKNEANDDPRLIIPVFDRLCCCLPEKWLKPLRCNIPYDEIDIDELGRYNMEGILDQPEDKSDLKQDEKDSIFAISSPIIEEIEIKENSQSSTNFISTEL